LSKFDQATIIAAQKAQKQYGVPSSVSLAQFAIESAYGTRMPSGSRNPFGMKAVGDQPFVLANTGEVIGGKSVTVKAKFRKFASFDEAFEEHAKLLATKPVYADAMVAWKDKNDLEGGIRLMAKKYATDPHYAESLLFLIRAQKLADYDHPSAPIPMPARPVTVTPEPQGNWLASLFKLILSALKALKK